MIDMYIASYYLSEKSEIYILNNFLIDHLLIVKIFFYQINYQAIKKLTDYENLKKIQYKTPKMFLYKFLK